MQIISPAGSPVQLPADILQGVAGRDSDPESGDEEWADATDTLDPTASSAPSSSSSKQPTHYPAGREPEESFTDEELKVLLAQSLELKTQANDLFRASDWTGAANMYERALGVLPRRREEDEGAGAGTFDPFEDDPEGQTSQKTTPATTTETDESASSSPPPPPPTLSDAQKELRSARAVLHANLAACQVKMNSLEQAVALCTQALEDDPTYLKALHRRAVTNDQINTWTSLVDAQKDYQRLMELWPAGSPLRAPTSRALSGIARRIEDAKKKETDEMVRKLRDLGNTVLGKFGLSTDNFKFTPNGEGGYSMNFAQ